MLDGTIITLIAPKTESPAMTEDSSVGDPRPTYRMRAFDTGENPLPGESWPKPRRTGWGRDYQ
jgi:hypothetical protein